MEFNSSLFQSIFLLNFGQNRLRSLFIVKFTKNKNPAENLVYSKDWLSSLWQLVIMLDSSTSRSIVALEYNIFYHFSFLSLNTDLIMACNISGIKWSNINSRIRDFSHCIAFFSSSDIIRRIQKSVFVCGCSKTKDGRCFAVLQSPRKWDNGLEQLPRELPGDKGREMVRDEMDSHAFSRRDLEESRLCGYKCELRCMGKYRWVCEESWLYDRF